MHWPSGCYCSDANDLVPRLGQTVWMSSADQNRLASSIKTSKLHKTNFVVDGRCPEHEYDRNVVENHPCVTIGAQCGVLSNVHWAEEVWRG